MSDDLFGLPKKVAEDRIKALEEELAKERKKTKLFNKLYNAVNYMQGELGAEGEIDCQNPKVEKVMDVLFDIDGGVFNDLPE
jgi:hypothetical protein